MDIEELTPGADGEGGVNAPERSATIGAERRRRLLQAELDRLVEVVAEQIQPERVVLFGSFAQGRVHEWSDLDVAVVAQTALPFVEATEALAVARSASAQ